MTYAGLGHGSSAMPGTASSRLSLPLMIGGLVLATVFFSGCGSAPSAEVDDQGRAIVHLTGQNKVSPMEVRIPVNGTVLWVVDGGTHDVTGEGGQWGSYVDGPGTLAQGATYQHTFTQAGEYPYYCFLHHDLGMGGTVIVR